MSSDEKLEKARQAVMRLRELLDLMHNSLGTWERSYESLFDALPAETADLQEKERQREAARLVIADATAIQNAVLAAQFSARDYMREFEALYNRIYELQDGDT